MFRHPKNKRGKRGYDWIAGVKGRDGAARGAEKDGLPCQRDNEIDADQFDEDEAPDGKRAKCEVGERLKEEDVGITELVGAHKRLAGILKERFSDFHVHEISLDKEVCKLDDQTIPAEPRAAHDDDELRETLPEAARKKLAEFVEANEDDAPGVEINVTEMGKDLRRTIHTLAKRITNATSETVQRGDEKFIALTRRKTESRKTRGSRDDRRVDWRSRGGDYCRFVLHKVNTDTMEALARLASKLRLRSDLFGYAGTKDRRARTSQWVTLKKVEPAVILRAAKKVRGTHVGNFKFCQKPLGLGALRGNRFEIALRSVGGTDEEAAAAVASLRDNGFINYYGLQRFGTVASVPTHEIGKALLRGEWENAVDLILKPRVGERDPGAIRMRRVYERTRDAALALRAIPDSRGDNDGASVKIETNLLRGIVNAGGKNHQGALDHVPRNARLMYMHAYQSLVWNRIVSRRIKEFGLQPIVGDLVYDEPPKTEVLEEVPDDDAPRDESSLPLVKSLSEEDLSRYTLADVVMPKPGWKVTYPSYARSWFNEFLAEDGLTTDLKQRNKKYSLGGGYRKILERPDDLSWKIVRYDGYHDDLLLCDVDKMRGLSPPTFAGAVGKYKALILEFSLNSSTYATMALREILDSDTSAETQAARSAIDSAKETSTKNANDMETPMENFLKENMSEEAATTIDELNDSNPPKNIEAKGTMAISETVKDDANVSSEAVNERTECDGQI